MLLRLHSFLPYSRANGPGTRAVVWTQGCSLACRGCFNPETHASNGGEEIDVADLVARIRALGDRISGVTISGGEPLQQADGLLPLVKKLRDESKLSLILFTGFSWHEILRMPFHEELIASVDVLVAGRYDARQRIARGLRGSANKTVHFLTDRYSAADLDAVPDGEVFINTDGGLTFSGIEPMHV